jgi:hypothetical protein
MIDRVASHTPFIPSVAFGLKALTMAMKAKCGRLADDEAEALVCACRDLLPDDGVALAAAQGFALASTLDQPSAGRALHDFIATWRAGQMAETADRVEEVLRDHVPDHFPEWQSRKDCGHG